MAMVITRGEWSQWAGASGTLTFHQALWTSNGTTDVDFNGVTIPFGMNFSEYSGRDAATTIFGSQGLPGALDTTRKRWITSPLGGHKGFGLWEVNELDWATGTWNPNGRPMPCLTRIVRNMPPAYTSADCYGGNLDSPDTLKDPHNYYSAFAVVDPAAGERLFENTLHCNDGWKFMPSVGRMLAWGGFGKDGSGVGGDGGWPVEWDPVTKQWAVDSSQTALIYGPGTNFQSSSIVWDSTNNWMLMWRMDDGTFWRYNPAAARGSRVALLLSTGGNATNEQGAMLYDFRRKRAVFLNAFGPDDNPGVWYKGGPCYFDMTNPTAPTRSTFTITGAVTIPGGPFFKIPGWAYDPIGDRYVLWLGGNTVYYVNPTTFVAEAFLAGGSDPGTREFVQGTSNGGYTFEYLPGDDVFIGVNHLDTAGFEVFAPTRVPTAPPALAFTDLTQAPRSGNPDTAFGLTANVHGAYVTVWGHHFGPNQGTSTLTLGGVAPSVITYWGPATPPFGGAANLANPHQRMDCIVFQVAGTTPLGLQSIVVTVPGQGSSSLALTVVSAGTIRLVSTDAGFSAAMAAMVSGDVTYVHAGTYNGQTVGPGSHGASAEAPLAVVAYPGESVTVGSASIASFIISSSFRGFWMTYAKMALYSANSPAVVGNGGAVPAITLAPRARAVGNLCKAPLVDGRAGVIATYGAAQFEISNIQTLGNEFTQCGNPAYYDVLHHVVYIAGPRGMSVAGACTEQETSWNYFHDNTTARAINYFNSPSNSGEVYAWGQTHVRVHDNVIVNQVADGILLGAGVIGENWVYNNLLINVGLNAPDGSGGEQGIDLRASEPNNAFFGSPSVSAPDNLLHIFNNTIVNAGYAGDAHRGALRFSHQGGVVDLHNNLIYQATGLPYVSTSSLVTPGAGQSSTNLWFGAGTPPTFDAGSIPADPQLVAPPTDCHLQSASGARGAGGILTTPSTDLDGLARPVSAPWDLGAYQFAAATASTVPAPVLLTVTPASVPAGSAGLVVSVTATGLLLSGATFFWNGQVRPSTVLSGTQATMTLLTTDFAAVGTGSIVASNPGSVQSNGLDFAVLGAPVTVTLLLTGDPSVGPFACEAQTTAPGALTVQFVVDGALFHSESMPAYSLFGGDVPPLTTGTLGPGVHTIRADVYQQGGSLLLATTMITVGAVPTGHGRILVGSLL